MIDSERDVSGSFPSKFALGGLFLEPMSTTFKFKGDAMPKGEVYGTRQKLIHSVGAVGKVKFISNRNHTYSGLFLGANHGIIRLSSAAQPSKTQPLVPGMALKFLIDGRESANVVAMYSIDG